MTDRQSELEKRLRDALQPEELQIKDQSHLHAGHAGAQDGRSHFAVRLTASAFEGCSRIQRHRLVYDAAGDMMDTDIHALSISALAPGESRRD
ncbi:BolA family protein [Lentisalinibacter sediminis]|uniref:BolA family protein n=1 Tax=Lentisalinibacter sediminis TaxID=2992237 RepID=UPI0038703CCA